MRDFRGSIRSEHNLYIECEHHLALEESLQVARVGEQAFRGVYHC
jgi:hypothetical protein